LSDRLDLPNDLQLAAAVERMGHPVFMAAGRGLVPPTIAAMGHTGTQVGQVLISQEQLDRSGEVSIWTSEDPMNQRPPTEYPQVRTTVLTVDGHPLALPAGLDDKRALIFQTEAGKRWLQIELFDLDPDRIQVVLFVPSEA